MIDILASVILLLLWGAIIIWAWHEHPGQNAWLVVAVSGMILGVTILGLLGMVDDPYCLRCS